MQKNSTTKPASNRIDITGHVYGRLTVITYVETRKTKPYWLCRCECGTKTVVKAESLRSGNTTSCGCRQRTVNLRHGCLKSTLYTIWKGIIQRCLNPNYHSYPDYGGRGITVCERWRDFVQFKQDMGERPSLKHSIERKDNNGPYSPENCIWATQADQGRNKRSNHFLELNGERLCIADWTARYGHTSTRIIARLNKGWSVERAITTPAQPRYAGTPKLTTDNVRQIRAMDASGINSHNIAAHFSVSHCTVRRIITRKAWGHIS